MRKAALLVAQATIETEVDFPLCAECSVDVLNELDDEAYDLDAEIEAYERELAFTEHSYFDEEDFSEELPRLAQRLVDYEYGMETLRKQIVDVVGELQALRVTDRELLLSKAEYWRQFEMHAADREAMLENTISAHNRLTHAKKWLDSVRSSHVINDAFYISVELHLATISNLRLGRLPSATVEWPEISAALGLVIQLLNELAIRASFVFTKHKLVLDGSFSGLQRVTNNSLMPLHSDGDISIVRLVQFKSINDALTALTECIAELAAHLKSQHTNFLLPFTIVKDLVAGVSIKRAWNSTGSTWSSALRSLLANLKYMLAFEAKTGLCV
jgi:beclin 1